MPAKKAPLHPLVKRLTLTKDDIRWATPASIAEHRAKRLRCKVIADLGCGAGFQAFAFAKQCKKVYAVEKDEEKLDLAKENAQHLGITNIIFILGDVLDEHVRKQVKDSNIVFCDPTRLPEERSRSMSTIQPDLQQLFNVYTAITKDIAIEFPPQMRTENILFDGEKEYLSLDGKLNRLTLYCGSLKKNETSAVVLPEQAVLFTTEATKSLPSTPRSTEEQGQFVYEVNPAVTKAELLAELSKKTATSCLCIGKRTLFTSQHLVESPFFCSTYQVVAVVPFKEGKIINELKKFHAGSVTLRCSIPPEEYWKVRRRYEAQLSGQKKITLFEWNGKALLVEKVV